MHNYIKIVTFIQHAHYVCVCDEMSSDRVAKVQHPMLSPSLPLPSHSPLLHL